MSQYPKYLNQPFQPQFNYPQYGYQPMQPDRLSQLQQFQQSLQPTQMSASNKLMTLGKIVDSVDVVKATDVPMDGNMYYFPKADGTEIYAKQWLQNGQTRILTFKPQFDDETNISSNNEEKLILGILEQFLEGIQNDIKVLNEKIDKISKPTRQRKEVSEDE